MRDEDRDPCEDTKDCGKVNEIAKDLFGVVRDVHECEAGKGCREDECWVGHAAAVGTLEDGRGRVVGGKAVEGAAGDVEIRV